MERRQHQRFSALLGAEVNLGEQSPRLGITQDISRSGVRLFTLSHVGVGRRVDIKIAVDNQSDAVGHAQIVRERDISDTGLWRREISMQFDPLLPEALLQRIREISVKQNRPQQPSP